MTDQTDPFADILGALPALDPDRCGCPANGATVPYLLEIADGSIHKLTCQRCGLPLTSDDYEVTSTDTPIPVTAQWTIDPGDGYVREPDCYSTLSPSTTELEQLRRQLDAAEAAPCRHDDATAPADLQPHQVIVTHLPPGFDHNDRQAHEYVIGNDVVGWTSYLVQHPAACHRLPYGEYCWFDDEWHNGQFDYDNVAPGLYSVTHGHQDVGDHHGEYSHTEDFLHYERIGDAPERPAPAAADAESSGEAPF